MLPVDSLLEDDLPLFCHLEPILSVLADRTPENHILGSLGDLEDGIR
jgi:hypothetical protein